MPDCERPGDSHRQGGSTTGGAPSSLIKLPVAAAAIAVVVVTFLPVTALAHASLVSADPAPGAVLAATPGEVQLTFSESVTPAGAGITVLSPTGWSLTPRAASARGTRMQVIIGGDGRGVPSTRVSRVDGLKGGVPSQNEGTYVVRWQVIASDTHPSRGQYTFSVGHPSAAAVSENQDVGAVAPAGLLLQAVARWLHLLGLALSVGVIAYMVFVGSGSGRLDRLVIAGIGLLVAAEPVAVAGQALSLGVVASDLLASSFGRVVGLRLGGALLFWAVLGAVDRAAQGRAALLVLGAILMLVDGAAGHRIVGLPDVATFGLGAVHEAAMAVWVGGLIAVLVIRSGGARFARFALGSFGVLGVSGALMAFTHLRAPGDLLFSIYGAVLVVKVLTVAAAAVIAALGARRLEAMALAAVLFLAGLLVSLPPPR